MIPRWHHYYPKWLQNHWNDKNNLIWCYDKKVPRVLHLGSNAYGKAELLYSSDLLGLNLELDLFQMLDQVFSEQYSFMSSAAMFDTTERVPNCICEWFVNLAMWTSLRHKNFVYSPDEMEHAVHVGTIAIMANDGIVQQEVDRFMKEFYYFFVWSKNSRIITSNLPVQEVSSKESSELLECKPLNDDRVSLLMFPLCPNLLFVATRHQEYKKYHRYRWDDEFLIDINYQMHIESTADQLYFPYRIYDPRYDTLPFKVTKTAISRFGESGSAFDFDHMKEERILSIIHSNYNGL